MAETWYYYSLYNSEIELREYQYEPLTKRMEHVKQTNIDERRHNQHKQRLPARCNMVPLYDQSVNESNTICNVEISKQFTIPCEFDNTTNDTITDYSHAHLRFDRYISCLISKVSHLVLCTINNTRSSFENEYLITKNMLRKSILNKIVWSANLGVRCYIEKLLYTLTLPYIATGMLLINVILVLLTTFHILCPE
jgi:hypothetical protein